MRKAGSYIEDDNGDLIPNPDDEAMTVRRTKKDESAEIRKDESVEEIDTFAKRKRR